MNRKRKIFALFLAIVMAVGLLGACGGEETEKTEATAETESTKAPETKAPDELEETKESADEAEESAEIKAPEAAEDAPVLDTPFIVGYNQFFQKFSPYYAYTANDREVASMTQVSLLANDRAGELMLNAGSSEGQVSEYNGVPYTYYAVSNLEIETIDEDDDGEIEKTVYHFTIRDDIKFSDGEPLTVDDIIFTYYAYSDPMYTGSVTLSSVPILGMNEYRLQTSAELSEKYKNIYADIMSKLSPAADAEGLGWDYEWQESDSFTAEQLDWVKEYVDQTLLKDQLEQLVDFIYRSYGERYAGLIGSDPETLAENDGLRTAWAMLLWDYGDPVEEDGEVVGISTVIEDSYEKEWDFTNDEYPRLDDWYEAIMATYGNNAYKAASVEIGTALRPNVTELEQNLILEWGPKDETAAEGGVPNISGIEKLSETKFKITVKGYDASAVYKLGVQVTPLHYYGDPSLYDYENNKFGIEFKNQDTITDKTSFPLGAGPYKYVNYENNAVSFEANEDYYLGAPKIKYVQFRETKITDAVQDIVAGTIDAMVPNFNETTIEEIKEANTSGGIEGDIISTLLYDFLGYGYIGINADNVLVGNDPASAESKNLRKAFATIFAQLRYVTNDACYGDRAMTIEYPISNTSWAAPRPADEGYQRAFSLNVAGEPIYKEDMDNEKEEEAAVEAAIGFFQAAGYTYDEAAGKFTAAPEGAKLEYEILIPADDADDCPADSIASAASELLELIGISLAINDQTRSDELRDLLDSGEQEIWIATRKAAIDPDMYESYHSSNIAGKSGSGSNYYHIADEELDQWIVAARNSADTAFRKETYKACLHRIIDWAVEIPAYQKKEGVIFSAKRVNIATLPTDITPFYSWLAELHKLEMN